jgi:hypothetical protein
MIKKFLKILVLACFPIMTANAEVISIGITGTAGMLDADGKETFNGGTTTKSEDLFIGYASGFVELHSPIGVRLGVSYVPYSLDSETAEQIHGSMPEDQGGTGETDTQRIKASIEDLASLYLSYHMDMSGIAELFVKGGFMQGDLITKENLGTGSQYGNATLEGTFYGAGIDKSLANGIFIRGEAVVTDFDDIKLTSTGSDNTNVIDISGLGGTNVSLSIGKTF